MADHALRTHMLDSNIYLTRHRCSLNYPAVRSSDSDGTYQRARVAVIIPCLNEERTIGKVVDDFRAELPGADIIVIDNCSTDMTAAVASSHGAMVVREPRK